MANNRLYLQCRKKDCDGAIMFAKFYPSGGFIAGEGAGWYVPFDDLSERLNKFFEEHQHDFDKNLYGGFQYELAWDVIGDGSTDGEKILEVIIKAIKHQTPPKETKEEKENE